MGKGIRSALAALEKRFGEPVVMKMDLCPEGDWLFVASGICRSPPELPWAERAQESCTPDRCEPAERYPDQGRRGVE